MDRKFNYRKSEIPFILLTVFNVLFGGVLMIRLGYSVGLIGFAGVFTVIIVAQFVIFPSAFALSEVSSNLRVLGRGNEHYFFSRSYGSTIGAVIALSLYISYAFSVSFYILFFVQAFSPVFDYFRWENLLLQRLIGILTTIVVAYFLLHRNKKAGYFFNVLTAILVLLVLILIMIARPLPSHDLSEGLLTLRKENISASFFHIFILLFPAFATVVIVISQSQHIASPGKWVPRLAIFATVAGFLVFVIIAAKLFLSFPPEILTENKFALVTFIKQGALLIPLVLAVSAVFSAGIYMRIASELLLSLGKENALPFKGLNKMVTGKKRSNNAVILTAVIALILVIEGNPEYVSQLVSQFFLVTFGMICLFSFLYRFAADPMYRPVFRSKWYISLVGSLFALWILTRIDLSFVLISLIVIVFIYYAVKRTLDDADNISSILFGALLQLNRNIVVFMQRKRIENSMQVWRPSVICVSPYTYTLGRSLEVMNWIAWRTGFGTYVHADLSGRRQNTEQSDKADLKNLFDTSGRKNNLLLCSLSLESLSQSVSQAIHFPGVTGNPNNVLMMEYDKTTGKGITGIQESMPFIRSSSMALMVYASASSSENRSVSGGIHIWLHSDDSKASYLQILFGNIIAEHPHWKHAPFEVFVFSTRQSEETSGKETMDDMFARLPVSPYKIHYVGGDYSEKNRELINRQSKGTDLTILNFHDDEILHNADIFKAFDELGDILFVNATRLREIN